MKTSCAFLSVLVVMCFGCSDDDGSSNNLSLSARASYTPMVAKTLSGHVTIDTAKILITAIKFTPQDTSGGDDAFKSGPYVIFLRDTNAHEVTAGDLPQGTYGRVKFEIHKPDQNEDVPDPDFREGPGGDQRYSMVIVGYYHFQRFVFKSRNTINQSIDIDPPVTIADSVGFANVTLRVDYSLWFMDGVTELDPTDSGASNVSKIEQSIRNSFRAFRDPDRDGDE